jgi:hypothetical protein
MLKNQIEQPERGSECEPIKFFLKEMTSPTR